MKCLCCDGSMRPFLSVPGDWRKPQKNITFEVWKCPRDGFGKVIPTPSDDILADHYNIEDYYTHSERQEKTKGGRPVVFRLLEALAYRGDYGLQDRLSYLTEMLRSWNLTRVLDIGAGGGTFMIKLDAAGFTVTGVEPDGNARSRQKNFPLPVHAGSAEDLPEALAGNSMDLVLMTHVFEHVRDPMKVLTNCRRLLSDQGRVFIEVPNADCQDFQWNPLGWQHLAVPRHLNFWTAASARAAFERAGFKDIKIHYRNYVRQFLWNWLRFGKPMLKYYQSRGAMGRSMKSCSACYSASLLVATFFASDKRRYDSMIIEAAVSDS